MGVKHIVAPGLNIMYGDAQNNFAWQTSGKLYQFSKGINPNFILNSSEGIDNKVKYLDFSKNPKGVNPQWNYVYSANNMPEDMEGYKYPGYYLPEDRAKRIVSLLESKNKWSKDDFSKMINDDVSVVSATVAHNFSKWVDTSKLNKEEKEALLYLVKWDGGNNVNAIAPTIYNKIIYFYLKNTFLDEMGELAFHQFVKTHVMKQSIDNQSKIENSVWWDNVATKNVKETRSVILTKAFKETVENLTSQLGSDVTTWNWGKVHQIEFKHPIGQVALLRSFFNVGGYEISGTNEVINNVMFYYTDAPVYDISAGPSTRRIVDFSDIENSISILPTGQSGNPMSKHYNDQAQMYVEGKFRKMKMNKKEIEASSTKLVFKVK